VPHLVREVRVGGDDVDLGAGFLELGVVLGGVFDFGRAIEGEGGRHEDQDRPLALEGLVGDLDEFAGVEGGGFERFATWVLIRDMKISLSGGMGLGESIWRIP
jgi:hypothetical protein